MKILACLLLASSLAGCAESTPMKSTTPNPPPTPVAVPVPTGPPPTSDPCPASLAEAQGKACSIEGQGCNDPTRAGWSIVCHGGQWGPTKTMLPPCCKP